MAEKRIKQSQIHKHTYNFRAQTQLKVKLYCVALLIKGDRFSSRGTSRFLKTIWI